MPSSDVRAQHQIFVGNIAGGIYMRLKNFKNMRKGLTLVEILVVILVISILIVALVPRVTAALDKAKETQIKTDFRTFATAVESVLRECAGFNGVPLMDENNKIGITIGAKFWREGQNIVEDAQTPATQSLIKAINRYLESSYQFDTIIQKDDGGDNANFGRSQATDPWGKQYEIYFVSRNAASNTSECVTDKVYIVANGRTQHQFYPDYMMLCEYKNGEVRTATAGFGDALSTDYTFYTGQADKQHYTLLASLFEADNVSHGLAIPESSVTASNIGDGTLFNMATSMNNQRLFIENDIGQKPDTFSTFSPLEAVGAEE